MSGSAAAVCSLDSRAEVLEYLPDEVYVRDGCLRLRSRRDFGSQHYTSGRVDTSGKFAPVYGRFEIRASCRAAKASGRRIGSIRRIATGRWNTSWRKPSRTARSA